MPPNASPAPPDHPGAPLPSSRSLLPAGAPRLRPVVGGYDIHRWPIHVPRVESESLPGWLRRLARRYGITPGAVLDEIGATSRRQVHPDLPALIRADPAGFTRVGLHPSVQAARASSRGATLEQLDGHYWADVRYRRTPRWARASRYCPACLADTGVWTDTWQHPYHLACTIHGLLLEVACPRCQARPLAKPTWLTHDGSPAACHDFINATSSTRYRRRCNTDLTLTPTSQAHPDLLAAQEWLWQVVTAADDGEPVTVIGLPVDAAIVYQAAAEVITENTHDLAAGELRFAEEHGLAVAHLLLTQTSAAAAAELAPQLGGFHPQQGAAPIGPLYRVTHRPRNPVISAISLQQHQGRLTVGAELKFRVGTSAPAYPVAWQVKTSALTLSAGLPELPMAAIPATLWPGSVTLGDPALDVEHGVDAPLGRALAALALARYGSTRGWRLLAVGLGLPARSATTGARHWHGIDQAGSGPPTSLPSPPCSSSCTPPRRRSTTNAGASPPGPTGSWPRPAASGPAAPTSVSPGAGSPGPCGASTPAAISPSRRHR